MWKLRRIIGVKVKVILALFISLSLVFPASARIVFDNEYIIDNIDGNNWIIDVGDDATGNIGLQFGNSIAETLSWNTSNSRFEFSDVVSLNENQIVEMEIENVSALPGGAGGLGVGGEGRIVILDTEDSTAPGCTGTPCAAGTFVWDGTEWDPLSTTGGSNPNPTKILVVASSGGDYTTIAAAATVLNTRGGGIIMLSAESHSVTTAVDLTNITLIGKGQEKTTVTVSGGGQLDCNGTNFRWLTLSSATGLTDDMIIDMASGSSSVIFEYVNFEVTDSGDVVIDSNAGTAPTIDIQFINSNFTTGSGAVLKAIASANLNSASTVYVENRTSDNALEINDWDVTLVGEGGVNTTGLITAAPGSIIFVSPDMNLQGAIDSLEATGNGGTVMILPGTHNISSTLTIEDNDIHILGYGDSSIIHASGLTGGATVGAIQVGAADGSSSVNDVSLEHFKLEVEGTGGSDIHGIRVSGGKDNTINDVTVIKISGTSGTGSGARAGIQMADGTSGGGGGGPDGYTKYFEITTNASSIASDESNFPVYFDMSELGDGHQFWSDYDATTDNDLVVTNSDGTVQYPVEVVNIDEGTTPNSGQLYFRVTSLDGDAPQTFRIYYDNPSVSAQPAVGSTYGRNNVWSNNYEAVLHLDEDGNNSTDGYIDSTGNGWDGTGSNFSTSSDVDGQVGRALTFSSSTNTMVDLGNVQIFNEPYFTISFWVNGASGQVDKRVYSEATTSGTSPIYGIGTHSAGTDGTADIYNRPDNGTAEVSHTRSTGAIFNSTWKMYSYVENAPAVTMVIDGVYDSDFTYTDQGTATFSNSALGAVPRSTPVYYYDGLIDEVRLSTINRTTNWLLTEFNNMDDQGTFFPTISSVYTLDSGTGELLLRPKIINSRVFGDSSNYFTDGIQVTSDADYSAGFAGNDQTIENAIIKGNQINYVREAGIIATGINDSEIKNNFITKFGAGAASKGIFVGNSANMDVTGNTISGSANASSVGLAIENINTGGAKTTLDSVFNDNVIQGIATDEAGLVQGINIGNATNTEVSRCIFTGNVLKGAAIGTTTAILISGNADNNIIADNDLAGGTNAWDTGVTTASSAQAGNTIRDNMFSNVTTYFSDSGTATQLGLNHHRAESAPTVNDDIGDGYDIGTIWVNILTDKIYQLTDNTLGAANWEIISPNISTSTGTTSETFIVDIDDSGGDIAIQFGLALAETLKWDSAETEFQLSDNLDINVTGEAIELGTGTASDIFVYFNHGGQGNFGWDDSFSATHTGGVLSTFNSEAAFRILQSSSTPVACSSTVAGMQWMDTDTGINYVCDTSNGRNKWLSVTKGELHGEETDTCAAAADPGSSASCTADWGNGLGSDTATDLGLYLPYPITITGYGFSEDNDACTSGSFDVEVWSTNSATDDNTFSLEQTVASGLTGQAHNSDALNLNVNGNQYILWGIDNNCGQAMDDWNVVLYYRYRHD